LNRVIHEGGRLLIDDMNAINQSCCCSGSEACGCAPEDCTSECGCFGPGATPSQFIIRFQDVTICSTGQPFDDLNDPGGICLERASGGPTGCVYFKVLTTSEGSITVTLNMNNFSGHSYVSVFGSGNLYFLYCHAGSCFTGMINTIQGPNQLTGGDCGDVQNLTPCLSPSERIVGSGGTFSAEFNPACCPGIPHLQCCGTACDFTPAYLKVTVSGVADAGCTRGGLGWSLHPDKSCADSNGTYILENCYFHYFYSWICTQNTDLTFERGPCVWYYHSDDANLYDVAYFEIRVQSNGAPCPGGGANTHRWTVSCDYHLHETGRQHRTRCCWRTSSDECFNPAFEQGDEGIEHCEACNILPVGCASEMLDCLNATVCAGTGPTSCVLDLL